MPLPSLRHAGPPCRSLRDLFWTGALLASFVLVASADSRSGPLPYEVTNVYPHDPQAFTQGLILHEGFFYEGTGLYGASSLRRVEVTSGRVVQLRRLPASLFGEGLTVLGERVIQLTWKSRRGFVYARRSFMPLAEFGYPTEGWGLTHDEQHLIMSDGSATLYFLDPGSFARQRVVNVHDERGPVSRLNELEYINGRVFANVYRSDRIVIIDPSSGRVTASLLLDALVQRERRVSSKAGVLNGIAYDAKSDRIFVTGKNWSNLYQLRLLEDLP